MKSRRQNEAVPRPQTVEDSLRLVIDTIPCLIMSALSLMALSISSIGCGWNLPDSNWKKCRAGAGALPFILRMPEEL